MKKPSQEIPVEWLAAYDTGIYRDEPKQFFPLKTLKDWEAFERRTKAETTFHLDSQLSEAEQYARKILERYVDRSQSTPELLAQWQRYARARRQKKKNAENLKPAVPYRVGFPRLPSKKDGIPKNVKRQVCYARKLLGQIFMTREAIEKSDAQKAAVHAYWVGRHFEALRVCQIEHNATPGRKILRSAPLGGPAKRAARQPILQEQRIVAERIWRDSPTLSVNCVAGKLEKKGLGKKETIRKYITQFRPK